MEIGVRKFIWLVRVEFAEEMFLRQAKIPDQRRRCFHGYRMLPVIALVVRSFTAHYSFDIRDENLEKILTEICSIQPLNRERPHEFYVGGRIEMRNTT